MIPFVLILVGGFLILTGYYFIFGFPLVIVGIIFAHIGSYNFKKQKNMEEYEDDFFKVLYGIGYCTLALGTLIVYCIVSSCRE